MSVHVRVHMFGCDITPDPALGARFRVRIVGPGSRDPSSS